MPVSTWEYEFTPSGPRRNQCLWIMLRDWHRARLLWLDLGRAKIDDRDLSELELERLNLWISGRGAWRCSALSHWDQDEILRRVLSGRVDVVPCGPSGAGRWAPGSGFEEVLRDRSQRRNRRPLFQVAKLRDEKLG